MTFKNLLETYNLSEKVKLKSEFGKEELILESSDRDAAWELYIHLITTILTQKLPDDEGTEQAALDSVYRLFAKTRDILTRHGREARTFAKIAVPVLNQVVRPFTASWHSENPFSDPNECQKFRRELKSLQSDMRRYAALLAYIAQADNILDKEDA